MFKKLFGKRVAREKWDAGLVWFRLRYLELEGPTRCINLLSRSQACGRVALYYRPGEAVSQLYMGIPETHVRLLQRMVADFGFSLKPKPPEVAIPVAGRMTAVTDLPWDSAFMAHIADEFAYVSLVEGENKGGFYLPEPVSGKPGRDPATWRLPDDLLPGLTLRPSWNGQQPPAHLVATEPDPGRWLLGRSQSGTPLHVSGRVNIYGRQEAVADWLVHQITQMVTLDHTNLVVIDGAGDLVPRLKRKAAVTRLLGEQLAYVDIDGASLANGFNPLAAAPGEPEAAMVQRWQRWFQGMNVHPQGIQLLARAQQEGVGDIPSLRKWLKQIERQGHYTAVSSLGMALNRLTASRVLREWLEWPANRFDILPEGALFFACKGSGWDREQLLQAVLLGAMQVADVRLVVHGLRGKAVPMAHVGSQERIVVSNGPRLPGSAIILTECHAHGIAALTSRFLANDARLGENLELLSRGEGIVIVDDGAFFTTWNGRVESEKMTSFGAPSNGH
ncbi:MAG: hypothetical protein CL608_26020 [Anaerolineaceae bacterium]|nr:hypothetical protein [Anaerolineaceae bacterium]